MCARKLGTHPPVCVCQAVSWPQWSVRRSRSQRTSISTLASRVLYAVTSRMQHTLDYTQRCERSPPPPNQVKSMLHSYASSHILHSYTHTNTQQTKLTELPECKQPISYRRI